MAALRIEVFGGALELLAVPLNLELFRPFRPDIEPFDPTLVRAAAFTAVFIALIVASVRGGRRLVLAACGIVAIFLLPVVARIQSLGQFPLADRFLYLPVLGWALAAVMFLTRFCPRRVAAVAVLALAALYGLRSHTRIADWHDEETLYRVGVEQNPRTPFVLCGLGRALLEHVNSTGDLTTLEEAMQT